MKTIISILSLIFLIISCERSDAEASDEGLIIGTWEGLAERTFNLDGSLSNVAPRFCKDNQFFIFRRDGTLFFRDFEKIGVDQCQQLNSQSTEGTWKRLENGRYTITVTNLTTGEPVEIRPENIKFDEDGSGMQIQFEPLIDNGKDPPFIYVTSFIKQN